MAKANLEDIVEIKHVAGLTAEQIEERIQETGLEHAIIFRISTIVGTKTSLDTFPIYRPSLPNQNYFKETHMAIRLPEYENMLPLTNPEIAKIFENHIGKIPDITHKARRIGGSYFAKHSVEPSDFIDKMAISIIKDGLLLERTRLYAFEEKKIKYTGKLINKLL